MTTDTQPLPPCSRGEYALIPQQLLLAFLFSLPLILVWPLPNKTELPQWHAATLFAALAGLLWLLKSRQSTVWTRLHTLVILSLATTLILSLIHQGIPNVQEGLQQQVTLALFFFLGAQYLSNTRGQQRLLEVTVLTASLIAAIGIAQYLSSSSLGLPATSPNASLFINKNYAGAFMNLATPAAFMLLLAAQGRRSLQLRTAGFFLCASYSLITLSRGHWLALVAALTLLLILFYHRPAFREWLQVNKANQHLATLVMLLAPMLLLLPSIAVRNIIDSTTVTAQLSDSGGMTHRLGFYRNTLKLIEDHPWDGIGPGAFYSGFQRYYADPAVLNSATELAGIAHAHNDYLEYLAELGIPGGIVAIALVIGFWYTGWRAATKPASIQEALTGAAFLVGITSIITHAMIDFPLSQPVPSIYLWTWAGAISGSWRRQQGTTDDDATHSNMRLRPLLATLAGLYLALVAFSSYRSVHANMVINEAVRATMAKQCGRALKLADRAFGLAPGEYLIWHHYLLISGFCDRRLEGRYMASELVLEQDPTHPYALLNKANILYQAGRLRQAATLYQQLVELLPHRVSGYLGLANIAMARGDRHQAMGYYDEARAVKSRIERDWYLGPAGQVLATLTMQASGDAGWAPPSHRRRSITTSIVIKAPPPPQEAADPDIKPVLE